MIRGIILVALFGAISTKAAEDLKTYYENQKAEIISTFQAPQLGSQVTIKISNGQSRTGILMKLSEDALTIMSETGSTMDYKRMALHETSRSQFFPEDFAHVKALELTKRYKDELHKGYVAEQAAGIHDGRISVSAKSEKNSDKEIEKEERENKQTGETRITTTTTRTYTDVIKLQLNISNLATHSDSFSVKYCFFSRRVAKGDQNRKQDKEGEIKPGTLALKNDGMKKVTIEPRGRKTLSIESEPFEIKKVEIDSGSGYGSNRAPAENGDESAGWLVILMYDGQVLDAKASAKTYLSEDWINKYK